MSNAALVAHLQRKALEAQSGSNTALALSKAARALEHAAPIVQLDDARAVKGVGPFVLREIQRFYKDSGGADPGNQTAVSTTSAEKGAPSKAVKPKQKPRKAKPCEGQEDDGGSKSKRRRVSYAPAVGSGAHAILVAMHEAALQSDYKGYILKAELIEKAQRYCEKPLTYIGPANTSNVRDRITAWSAMNKTLIEKGLVIKNSSPAQYSLSPEGQQLAAECAAAQHRLGGMPQAAPKQDLAHASASSSHRVATGSRASLAALDLSAPVLQYFNVVLLLDHRERLEADRQAISQKLREISLLHEMRELRCGDVMWVAQSKEGVLQNRVELVLDDLAERKTVPDLLASITDNRYARQRHTLKACRVPRVVYVVEGDTGASEVAEAAIETIRVDDGFLIKETADVSATVRFYADVTRSITQMLSVQDVRTLMSGGPQSDVSNGRMLYEEFHGFLEELDVTSVQTIFSSQLRQVPQCGSRRAEHLATQHPCLASLVKYYDTIQPDLRPAALTALKAPGSSSRFPLPLSRDIHACFC